MSIYNALYGRDGHGVGPNEPEKKGFARFCQMVGRDLGQLLGTNLMVCVLCLPAALGVSLGVTLLSLPLTVVCSAVTGLLTGPAMVLLADCALRSLQNDPSQWLPRAKQTLAAHWKAACGFGCIGTLVLGLLCFVSAFVFEAAAQQGYYPGLAILVFLALDFLVLAVLATLCAAVLPLQLPAPDSLLRRAGRLLAVAPGALRPGRRSHAGGHRRHDLAVPGQRVLGGAVRLLAAGAGSDADPVPGFAAGIRRRGAQHPAPGSAG